MKPDKTILKFINKINEWLIYSEIKKNINEGVKILPDIRT